MTTTLAATTGAVLRRVLAAVCSLCVCGTMIGCDSGGAEYRKLAAENVELRSQLAKAQQELQQLVKQHVELKLQRDALLKIQGKRVEAIPEVAKVELGKWTGGYSLSRGKGHDSVKVYLVPMDASGSAIKSPGSVTIRLFDLAAPKGQEQVGQCELDPRELEKQWFSGAFMTYHYSVVCPFTRIPEHADITVRAEFIDYVSGKTFNSVATIKIDKPDKLATTQPTTQAK